MTVPDPGSPSEMAPSRSGSGTLVKGSSVFYEEAGPGSGFKSASNEKKYEQYCAHEHTPTL
jgi:hypothetical protein